MNDLALQRRCHTVFPGHRARRPAELFADMAAWCEQHGVEHLQAWDDLAGRKGLDLKPVARHFGDCLMKRHVGFAISPDVLLGAQRGSLLHGLEAVAQGRQTLLRRRLGRALGRP